MDNEWSKINNDMLKKDLIEEYVKDTLSKYDSPLVLQNRSIDNVLKAMSRGRLTDSDFEMKENKIFNIKNLSLKGEELKVIK